jgi:hypothetical protein
MIHLCLELRANRRGAKIKLKLILLTVECKAVASSLSRLTNLVARDKLARKSSVLERIAWLLGVGPHFRLVPHDATADFEATLLGF